MKQTLSDMKIEVSKPISILYDNTSVISISKNLVMYACIKHIDIRYHFHREKVQEDEVCLNYVNTEDQVENIFTKPLSKEIFESLRKRLGLVSFSSLS